MENNFKIGIILLFIGAMISWGCADNTSESSSKSTNDKTYPSNIISYLSDCRIMLGNGDIANDLNDFEHSDFFYSTNDGTNWVVYKTPNRGTTSPNSNNTRTELAHKEKWIPETGGKMTGKLKVMHVSTSGDARVAASYSTVVGQIHSGEGHENEPLKIFYKKFPDHQKGSVFWNYEINTEGDNAKRWDFSTAVWGHDMAVVGGSPTTYPEEPSDGVALGEEFGYEVNVYKGIMYLTFTREGYPTKTFTKSLIESDYTTSANIPMQTRNLFGPIGRDGLERSNAYSNEIQYFKQGAYNQTNGKAPETNIVWSTGSDTYDGDLMKQYENGSYTEVWFKEAKVGAGSPIEK